MLNFNYENQAVIVTGGTRGIGKAITTRFIESGATVIAIYRSDLKSAEALKDQLGEKLIIKQLDVSDFGACESFFEELKGMDLDVKVLVNNSGIRRDGLLPMMKEEQWDSVINTNLKGTFNMSRFAVNHFLRNRYGRIINIASIGGIIGLPGQTNYSASKAGQIAFSKSLSKEVAKKNITINNIAPGFIETELIADLPEEQVKEYKKQVPMKRFGTSKEVADTVLFLASQEAAYITGSTIEITGGL